MPDVWAESPHMPEGGTSNRRTPVHVPDVVPHLSGVATAGLSVAIVFENPSVHHGRPLPSTTIMCGVPLSGRTIGYSKITSGSVVSRTATRSTLLLFSVNQISPPLNVMPYGFELALGVLKSLCACVSGSNLPTADARCSVYQISPFVTVRSQGPLPAVT